MAIKELLTLERRRKEAIRRRGEIHRRRHEEIDTPE